MDKAISKRSSRNNLKMIKESHIFLRIYSYETIWYRGQEERRTITIKRAKKQNNDGKTRQQRQSGSVVPDRYDGSVLCEGKNVRVTPLYRSFNSIESVKNCHKRV